MELLKSVVVVNDHARINGGAALVAISSALGLAQRGYRVHFVASVGEPDPRLAAAGINVTSLGRPPYNQRSEKLAAISSGIWDKQAAAMFEKVLREQDPSSAVVHLHTFRDALSSSVAAKSIERGFVTCYSAHEYSSGCPYGGFYDYRHGHACFLKGLSAQCIGTHCNDSSYSKKIWFVTNQSVYRHIAKLPRKFSRTFFVSEKSEEILRPYYPPTARKQILRNPIDIEKQSRPSISDASPFIFVGALNEFKDPLTIATAAKIAKVPVVFVGEGPLRDQILAINPDAQLTGWLPPPEVVAHMRKARAILMSSRGFETYGLSLAEGAACGIGGIVSSVCIAADWIKKTGAGAIFKTGDPSSLAEELLALKDIDHANKIGRLAYEAYWADPPTLSTHLDSLVRGYEEELLVNGQMR